MSAIYGNSLKSKQVTCIILRTFVCHFLCYQPLRKITTFLSEIRAVHTTPVGAECLDVSTLNSQTETERNPTFLRLWKLCRKRFISRVLFPVTGLSLSHSYFIVFLHPLGSSFYIATRCLPSSYCLSLLLDTKFCALETTTKSQRRTE